MNNNLILKYYIKLRSIRFQNGQMLEGTIMLLEPILTISFFISIKVPDCPSTRKLLFAHG